MSGFAAYGEKKTLLSKQNKWYQMERVSIFYASPCVVLRGKEKHSLKPSFEVDHRLKLKTM